jgi:lipoprotein NlpD
MRLPVISLLATLLVACSSTPVNAPVGSRTHEPQAAARTQPVVVTAGKPRAVPAGTPMPAGTPTPAPRTTGDTYSVRRGDTLYSIAWQHGLGVDQLAGMNAIRKPYTIYTGQRLRVRPGSKPVPATAPPRPKPAAQQPARSAPKPDASAPPAPRPAAAKPAPKLPSVVKHWVWPTKGRVINGYRPNAPGKKGIDISGKKGQPVKAAAAGKVVYSGSGLVGYGRLIIVKHNETLLSAYGHNSKLLVSEGDYVKAGQVIANMGSSGTDRTQLYFEIRKNGKPVNPLRYLPRG